MRKHIYRGRCATPSVDIEPVADSPSLLVRGRKKWICIADLHIGIEAELAAGGFKVPSQTPKMLSALEKLSTLGTNLLVLGDVKHRIPYVGRREDRELRPFLARIQELFSRTVVVAGNHDGGLSDVLPSAFEAFPGKGVQVESVGAFHGHVWPSEEIMGLKKIVMGHVHPSVLLPDSSGHTMNEKCWVRAKLSKATVLERYRSCPAELVIVPAFNPLITGTPVNTQRGTMLGPMFRNNLVERSDMRVYLLDGTALGQPPLVPARERRGGSR
jgi:putative SbcD/Mre11-related phosphoesterase